MQKKYLLVPLLLISCVSAGFSQISPLIKLNQNYQTGLELLQNEKYAAAAQQFKLVEQARTKNSTQKESNADLSIIKENAKFYSAVCALELGNNDAEALFREFIHEYPLNSNIILAYFHVGNSHFGKKKLCKCISMV